MGDKFTQISPALYRYLAAHTAPPDPVLVDLMEETKALGPASAMQIAPDEGALLTLLTKLIDARFAVEVGTFTGYSSICIARGLSPGGKLLTCDVSQEWTAIAKKYFERASAANKITLALGPALKTLRSLDVFEHIDLAFVDADKAGYVSYYEELLPRMRTNGLIVFDNVLWSGNVIDPSARDEDVAGIRNLNDRLIADRRVDVVMLPVADGVSLVRKK